MSDDKVTNITSIKKANTTPDEVLEFAKGKLAQVMVIGFSADGRFYSHSNSPLFKDMIYLLATAHHEIMMETLEPVA